MCGGESGRPGSGGLSASSAADELSGRSDGRLGLGPSSAPPVSPEESLVVGVVEAFMVVSYPQPPAGDADDIVFNRPIVAGSLPGVCAGGQRSPSPPRRRIHRRELLDPFVAGPSAGRRRCLCRGHDRFDAGAMAHRDDDLFTPDIPWPRRHRSRRFMNQSTSQALRTCRYSVSRLLSRDRIGSISALSRCFAQRTSISIMP